MDILKQLAEEFKIRNTQVENTVKLIDDGNFSYDFVGIVMGQPQQTSLTKKTDIPS